MLVTGGAYFIGSHLVDRLVEEGALVRVFDNFGSGRLENIAHRLGEVELVRWSQRVRRQER
ncbi:MAG: NAD-dependent epimerase/dehydratase family protein [Nitrososphaerota archaeon]